MKSLVFIEEISGLSKKDKPYHLIKLADSDTFENHTISYCPVSIQKNVFSSLKKGEKVIIDGQLTTPFGNTQFQATSIKKAI